MLLRPQTCHSSNASSAGTITTQINIASFFYHPSLLFITKTKHTLRVILAICDQSQGYRYKSESACHHQRGQQHFSGKDEASLGGGLLHNSVLHPNLQVPTQQQKIFQTKASSSSSSSLGRLAVSIHLTVCISYTSQLGMLLLTTAYLSSFLMALSAVWTCLTCTCRYLTCFHCSLKNTRHLFQLHQKN